MKLDSSISAVITGAASGLGAATARALAELGVKVAVFDIDADLGEALAQATGAVFCKVNVRSDGEVDAGFIRSRNAIGQERILINCAGIASAARTASRDRETGEIQHCPLDSFEKVIQINLVGTFRCIAKSAAGMMSLAPLDQHGERGVIINTASVAAVDGQIGQASYAASKSGIVGMTLPIARDLMNEGIRVNSILPGTFDTPLLQGLSADVRAGLSAAVPFPKRLGQPAEFASLVVEMCRNGYFNGASVRLDGAIRMPPR